MKGLVVVFWSGGGPAGGRAIGVPEGEFSSLWIGAGGSDPRIGLAAKISRNDGSRLAVWSFSIANCGGSGVSNNRAISLRCHHTGCTQCLEPWVHSQELSW